MVNLKCSPELEIAFLKNSFFVSFLLSSKKLIIHINISPGQSLSINQHRQIQYLMMCLSSPAFWAPVAVVANGHVVFSWGTVLLHDAFKPEVEFLVHLQTMVQLSFSDHLKQGLFLTQKDRKNLWSSYSVICLAEITGKKVAFSKWLLLHLSHISLILCNRPVNT